MCSQVEDHNDTTRSAGQQPGCQNHRDPHWKQTIRQNLELWLAEVESLEQVPAPDRQTPDLDSLFSQLCVISSEFRKASRRSHDSFVRFGRSLENFEQVLEAISSRLAGMQQEHDSRDVLSRKRLFLPLVEMYSRLRRTEARLARPPRTGLWVPGKTWKKAWQDLKEGFAIVCSHFEQLLASQGITAIETVGKPFDPLLMTAVAVEDDPSVPEGTVIEELESGFLYQGHLLKLAQVKVSRSKGE